MGRQMTKEMENEYVKSIEFWNNWLGQEEEIPNDFNPDTDWKEIGSKELAEVTQSLGTQKKVLDYGCGSGWASVIIAKSGCDDVTAVDVSENGVLASKKYAKLFHAEDKIRFQHITPEWIIDEEDADKYDGFFCSNVLDVVPRAISETILKGASRVCKDGAKIVIGMNPFFTEEMITKNKMIETEEHHLTNQDILRIVNYTDEEWKEIFSKYFTVVECKHFRWDGEKDTVNRRIFILTK